MKTKYENPSLVFVKAPQWGSGCLNPSGRRPRGQLEAPSAQTQEGWCSRQTSGELRLLGLWQQEGHEPCGEEQERHQQNWDGAVWIHHLAEDDVASDGCHSAHSGEEAQSRGAGGHGGERWKILEKIIFSKQHFPKSILYRYVYFFWIYNDARQSHWSLGRELCQYLKMAVINSN